MNKIYKKHELLFITGLIMLYVLSNSLCIEHFGNYSYITFIVNLILLFVIFIFICKNKYNKYLGLRIPKNIQSCLYFIPLIIISCVNLYNEINISNSLTEIIFYILIMLCVGFIEEIIFRGFLFKMIMKISINQAVIVTSITFGIGHIVNLFNGSLMLETLFQIFYAFILGYLYVIIFLKTDSIIPAIASHSFINATSIFNINNIYSTYIIPTIIIIITMIYTEVLKKNL